MPRNDQSLWLVFPDQLDQCRRIQERPEKHEPVLVLARVCILEMLR